MSKLNHAKGYGTSQVSCTMKTTDCRSLARHQGSIPGSSQTHSGMTVSQSTCGGSGIPKKMACSSGSEGFSEGERRVVQTTNGEALRTDSGKAKDSGRKVLMPSERHPAASNIRESRSVQTRSAGGKVEDVDSDCGSLPSTPGLHKDLPLETDSQLAKKFEEELDESSAAKNFDAKDSGDSLDTIHIGFWSERDVSLLKIFYV